jgi:hypothetical protein
LAAASMSYQPNVNNQAAYLHAMSDLAIVRQRIDTTRKNLTIFFRGDRLTPLARDRAGGNTGKRRWTGGRQPPFRSEGR